MIKVQQAGHVSTLISKLASISVTVLLDSCSCLDQLQTHTRLVTNSQMLPRHWNFDFLRTVWATNRGLSSLSCSAALWRQSGKQLGGRFYPSACLSQVLSPHAPKKLPTKLRATLQSLKCKDCSMVNPTRVTIDLSAAASVAVHRKKSITVLNG
jgi:hypothetical protein